MISRLEKIAHDTIITKIFLTILIGVFAYYRQPELLLEPRFWAEEGRNYFSYAYNHSWLRNLLHPQFGYYTLYNSIATSIAASFAIEYAPYVTTYLSFFVQIFVSSLVIWWPIPKIDSLLKKLIVALSIQYLAYARIWTTTIGVQYWLCIATFLILLSDADTNKRWLKIFRRCLLIHNGLTGVLSCFMIPAFLLKWYRTRSRELVAHTAILCACLLVQVSVYAHSVLTNTPGLSNRLVYNNPVTMLSKFIKFQFKVPFSGQSIANRPFIMDKEMVVRELLYPVFGESIFRYSFLIIEQLIGLSIVGLIIVLAAKTIRQLETQLFLTSFIFVSILSTLFSINMSGGPRYTFAPSVMVMVFVVGMAGSREVSKYLRAVAMVLITSSLFFCISDYRTGMTGFAYDPDWPKWKDEVARWNISNAYEMKIWPPPWTMNLSQK